MPVIGDMRRKEFQRQDYVFGEIVPAYCYRLVLHASIPDCPTDRVIKLWKKDVKKLRKMNRWERHYLLKQLSKHPMPFHKRKFAKIR